MRETWIYGLAFLLILGVGGALLWPRLGGEAPQGVSVSPDDATEVAPPAPDPDTLIPDEVSALLDASFTQPEPRIDLTIEGTRALVVDEMVIEGGELVEPRAEGKAIRLTLLPRAGSFLVVEAPGHLAVRIPVEAIPPTHTITLVPAAPPVVVEVVEADGTPVPDVPLDITPEPAAGAPRTDARGRVTLASLPRGLVEIAAEARVRSGPRRLIDARETRALRLVLEPAWEIRGTALRPDGHVARSARVSVLGPRGEYGQSTLTDGEGRFVWRGPALSIASLVIRGSGLVASHTDVRAARAGLRTDLGEVLLPGTGTSVACTLKTVVPGAKPVLTVEPQVAAVIRELFGVGHALYRPIPLTQESDGQWVAEGLPADLPLRVRVRGSGEALDIPFEGRADEVIRLTLAPRSGHVLAAVLKDPEGNPLAGVPVLLSREPRDGDQPLPDDIVLRTGRGGGVQVFGLTGSTWYLRAYVPGYRSLLRRMTLPLSRAPELLLTPAIKDADRRVSGRVLSMKRAPLAGVRVRAAGVETLTDATGTFTLEGVESVAPTVRLAYGHEPGPAHAGQGDATAFVPRGVQAVTPGMASDLDLVLKPTGSLRLRALDLLTDKPLEVVHCLVQSPRDGRVLFDRAVATRDGLIELGRLPAGPVTVALMGPSVRLNVSARIQGGETLDLGDQLLGRGMHVRGKVTDSGGRPIAGAWVAALDLGWQHRGKDPARERETLFRRVQTNDEGEYTLRGLNPRRAATLAFWAPELAPVTKRVLLPAFSDDVEAEVDAELADGSWLMLVLQDELSMKPVSGVSIALESSQGEDYLDTMHMAAMGGPLSNDAAWRLASEHFLFEEVEAGNYVIGPLVPGPFLLWIERPGYAPRRQKLTVLGRGQNVLQEMIGKSICEPGPCSEAQPVSCS